MFVLCACGCVSPENYNENIICPVCTVWVIYLKLFLLLWFKSSLNFSHGPIKGFRMVLLSSG